MRLKPMASQVCSPGQPGAPRSAAYWLRRSAPPLLALLVCALLLVGLQRLTLSLDYHAVVKHLFRLPGIALIEALAATALSYLALIGRDAVALRYLGARVTRPTLWLGAITGSALGNAAGFGVLTGGAVRYRILGAAGVRAEQVARLSVLTAATFALGLVTLAGLGATAAAPMVGEALGIPSHAVLAGGLAALALSAAIVGWTATGAHVLRFRRFSFEQPGFDFVIAQLGLVAIDVIGAGLVLWVLLPAAHVGFTAFIALYTAALLLGVIAHTPGGIGVFEAAMLYALGGSVPASAAVAALLAYRAIYFGLPLLLSAGLLGAFETRAAARWLQRSRLPAAGMERLAPTFLGVITFVIGMVLVLSGATPAFNHRLALLHDVLPLWVLEGSNLLGSVLGVWLLFVARGLLQRLDAAWWLALSVATASLLLSLAKGLAFVEAGMLGFLIMLLLLTRPRFRRPASLFQKPLTLGWWVVDRHRAAGGVLGLVLRFPPGAVQPGPVVAVRVRRQGTARAARHGRRRTVRLRHRPVADAAACTGQGSGARARWI